MHHPVDSIRINALLLLERAKTYDIDALAVHQYKVLALLEQYAVDF